MALFVLGIFYICVYFITKKQRRYNSILEIRKWAIIFTICILISYTFTNIKDREYKNSIDIMRNSSEYDANTKKKLTKNENNTNIVSKSAKYEKNANVRKELTQYEKYSAIEYLDKYIGIIISNPTPKEYYTKYLLKLTKVNNKDVNITVYLKLKGEHKVGYGDEISFIGEYEEPDAARNDKGFDYKQYLKSNRNSRRDRNKTSTNN